MADEIPTFESMFRKSKGLDIAEEAPSEEEDTPSEKQRSRVYDKLTDEDGNSRLKHKANVPALENYDQDIRAPQGEVHDADKLRLKKSERYAPDREVLERLATLPPEMQRKVLDQIDGLSPSTPWDIKPKFSMEGDDGWESGEQGVAIPERHMPGDDGWVSGSWNSVEKSIREMIARECFEKTGRIPDVEFMDTYEVKKAALDAESDTPIEDREARRLIGKTAPQLVERVSSWNEGAPLTDTDGQELGQMTGASSTRYAYNTNDFTMEDAALKNENALEKALRGYLDSNPNISIEDLEKFIESSKGGFRIGVETPFL